MHLSCSTYTSWQIWSSTRSFSHRVAEQCVICIRRTQFCTNHIATWHLHARANTQERNRLSSPSIWDIDATAASRVLQHRSGYGTHPSQQADLHSCGQVHITTCYVPSLYLRVVFCLQQSAAIHCRLWHGEFFPIRIDQGCKMPLQKQHFNMEVELQRNISRAQCIRHSVGSRLELAKPG